MTVKEQVKKDTFDSEKVRAELKSVYKEISLYFTGLKKTSLELSVAKLFLDLLRRNAILPTASGFYVPAVIREEEMLKSDNILIGGEK
jgi:hypothetical protein